MQHLNLTHKHYNILERTVGDKHSSLLVPFVKSFTQFVLDQAPLIPSLSILTAIYFRLWAINTNSFKGTAEATITAKCHLQKQVLKGASLRKDFLFLVVCDLSMNEL
jgi:hypothetical protein